MSQRPLDVIEVKNPCPADWTQMTGDATRRFCSHCKKFVHNLSEMPADEAERLVCESGGNLCVRFSRDIETGRILTLDYAPRPKSSRRRAIATIASVVAAVACGGGWAAMKLLFKPAPTQIMVAGDIGIGASRRPIPAPPPNVSNP